MNVEAGGTWLNGRPPTVDDLRALALSNYGHFTAMQVRSRAIQGLEFHVERLQSGTRELFGTELPRERILAELRAALAGGAADCSLRFTVFARGFDYRKPLQIVEPDVLVTLTPPASPRKPPLRAKSYRFVRPLPQVKHVGTFPLFHYRRQAQLAGYDDALFVADDGCVVEGSVWNLGFWDGESVVWPEGPALRGTAERLLQMGLAELGVPQRHRSVALIDVGGFRAAFASNASGLQAVTGIDGVEFPATAALSALLDRALASRPWETP